MSEPQQPYDPFQEPPRPEDPSPGPYPWGWPAEGKTPRRKRSGWRRSAGRQASPAAGGSTPAEDPAPRSRDRAEDEGPAAPERFGAGVRSEAGRHHPEGEPDPAPGESSEPYRRTAAEPAFEPEADGRNVRSWIVATHLSPLLAFLIGVPFLGVLAPLVIWQTKRETMPEIDYHGREAVNFQLSVLLWSLILLITCVGPVVVQVANVILCIVAAVRASDGERYRYPWTWRPIAEHSASSVA